MDFLKDTLQQYGATAEFWATASSADRDATRDEAWDEVKSLVRSLPESEALALLNKITDQSVLGNKPTYLSLAEIYAERGDAEAASKAREKAYQAVLNEYPDPEDLSRLGYLLLKHCGVDELPLCEEDFGEGWVVFGDSVQLYIESKSYEPKVPEFADKAQTITTAIRAFGLAWLYYQARYDREMKTSEAWHELLTLDGLRVAFLQAGDLDAVRKVCQHFFDTWLDYWDDVFAGFALVDPFVANFRETAGYLQGRLTRDPANRRAAEERLAAKLGDVWQQVGAVRLMGEYLINAEILFEQLDKKGDWSSAVNDLSKAVEAIIKQTVGAHADRNPTEPFADLLRQTIGQRRRVPPRSFSRLSLSTFTNAFADLVSNSTKKAMFVAWIRKWVPEADASWPDELVRQLKELSRPRYRSDHAVQPGEPWKVSYGEAERVHALVLGIGQTGLLPALARLHSGLAGNNA